MKGVEKHLVSHHNDEGDHCGVGDAGTAFVPIQ